MDYPGFVLSEGLHGYIPSFDSLVDDVIEHYDKVKGGPEFQNLPSFLFGQSMGGAVVLKLHLKQPDAWTGAILVAPMCKIADDMVPPWAVKQIPHRDSQFPSEAQVSTTETLGRSSIQRFEEERYGSMQCHCLQAQARIRTALEMLKTTQEIEQRLEEVSLPLLILHGEADIVTDPSVSKELHEKAKSSDKNLKLYKDAYHSLLEGEHDETIIQVSTT